ARLSARRSVPATRRAARPRPLGAVPRRAGIPGDQVPARAAGDHQPAHPGRRLRARPRRAPSPAPRGPSHPGTAAGQPRGRAAMPGVDATLLGGKPVRRIPLLAALQEHDVVHFAGHSHYDAGTPARSGWQLAEGILTAGDLAKLRPPPVLVFSNSCEAGTTPAWEGGYGYEGHAFGIGSAFLLSGVRNYVGTFWVVHDEESVLFAITCYRALAA